MILLAHIFYNYTIVLRLVSGFWANLDPRLVEAGQMLGVSPWRAFRQITWPLLMPVITAAALLVFIFCFTSFGVILILGGPRFATLEVEIYRQAVNLFNLPLAAALSLIQIVFIFALTLIYTRLQARTTRPLTLQSRQSSQRIPQSWRERLWVWGNLGLMVILLGAPLAALVLRSLTAAGQFSLNYYRALISPPPKIKASSSSPQRSHHQLPHLRHSHRISSAPPRPVSRYRPHHQIKMSTVNGHIPEGTHSQCVKSPIPKGHAVSNPQLSSTLSSCSPSPPPPLLWVSATLSPLIQPPLNLRTSPVLIVIAHTLVALPFVVRSLLPALRSIQPVLREAAAVLGASPPRVWREIDLPIASRALARRRSFCLYHRHGRVWSHRFHRPARHADHTRRYFSLSRPAGGAQLRSGSGYEHAVDAGLCYWVCGD